MQHLVSIAGSQTRKIYAEHGENLADVLVRAGLAIALPCNGMGRCKSCRVRIDGAAQSSEF
ncbi:MAG: 2Fe-2S iron-sulfur cluster-binding protein, partial [Christensenellales bacterium]